MRIAWLTGAAVVIFTWNVIIAATESHGADFLHLMYLGLAAFVGSYAPVMGQAEVPSLLQVIGLTAALALTFTAIVTAVAQLVHERFDHARRVRSKSLLIVIGPSKEATEIARSGAEAGRVVLEMHHPEVSASFDRITRKAFGRAVDVVVAVGEDGRGAALGRRIVDQEPRLHGKVHVIVAASGSPVLVRPAVLSGQLPSLQLFSPIDNVGQMLVGAITERAHGRDRPLRVRVRVSSDQLAVPLRMSTALKADHILGVSASFELVNGSEADLDVLVGDTEFVLQTLPSTAAQVLVVTDLDLYEAIPRHDAGKNVAAFDMLRTGCNYALIVEDLLGQWARAFHRAHGLLHGNAVPWTGHRLESREAQMSEQAVRFMMEQLWALGFEFVLDGRAAEVNGAEVEAAEVTGAEAERLARAEHDDWLYRRTWRNARGEEVRGPVRADGSVSTDAIPWADLSDETRRYLLSVPRYVYPAVAASLGFVMVRRIVA